MKVINSNAISPFGGLNFVLNELEKKQTGRLLDKHLPKLACQSKYSWKDIFYSLWSVTLCGGDCAEDLGGNFQNSLTNNPFLNVPSPDRVLSRLKEIAQPYTAVASARGYGIHQLAINKELNDLNLKLIKLFFPKFTNVTLDYDNTLSFNTKKDAQKTYKGESGYCPGVGIIGSLVAFVENRNGRSDAKTLQDETLARMFERLEANNIRVDRFRADSASYSFKCLKVIEENSNTFYVRGRMSETLEKAIKSIKKWRKVPGIEQAQRGECIFKPFQRVIRKESEQKKLKEYRLIVTKEKRRDGQINAFTGEDYHYSMIVTNDRELSAEDVIAFYNKRGAIEREFDVLKNDFNWNKLPFSLLEQNQVYMLAMAMCRNIYHFLITRLSGKSSNLKKTDRLKKFIFRFIAIPAKWLFRGRQWHLKMYGKVNYSP